MWSIISIFDGITLSATDRTFHRISVCHGSRPLRISSMGGIAREAVNMILWMFSKTNISFQDQNSLLMPLIVNCGYTFPPNRTYADKHSLHPSFTHRESPAFVAVFLNLYNSSSLKHPASEIPPLDHRPTNRAWRTSHLISFLGHVSLERFKDDTNGDSYVRAMINGKQEVMGGCEDGVRGSCKWKTFKQCIEHRVKLYKDWESVCEPKDK